MSIVNSGNEIYNDEFVMGNLNVSLTCMEDGEIAILNKSDFYICPACGYALGDFEANAYTKTLKKEHRAPSGRVCNYSGKLQKKSLGYRFKTDACQISLRIPMNREEAYSVLQSLILSACDVLNIDNGEISGCVLYTYSDIGATFEFILYDTTPGGAGHVKRIRSEAVLREVIARAYAKAKNCDCGGEEGDSSCYKCLRTYQNQQHHDELKRRYVIDILSKAGAIEGLL